MLLRNKTFFGYQQSLMVDQVRSQLLADSPVAIQVRITTDLFGEEDATKQCSVIGKSLYIRYYYRRSTNRVLFCCQ